jgi:predicted AAA+ superfamily ATPase
MYQLIQDLLAQGNWSREDILFVDFEDYRLTDFTAADTDALLTAFQQVAGKAPTFLFFDEIQQLPGWSRVLRTLHNQNRYRIAVTGSNADLLEREIATELRGRCRNILLMPFSFPEFLRFHGIPDDERTLLTPARGRVLKAFEQYLHEGGFPEVVKKETVTEKRELLQTYYRTIFYRDILERYNVKAKTLLEAVMRNSLNTFSDLFSISLFEKELKRHQLPGSKQTISNYLGYLREVFFLTTHDKFSYSPRQRIMNPKKIYLLDTGFSLLSTDFSENRGKLLENAVAVEMFRRRAECFYYKGRRECDFIIKEGTKPKAAIQVCWELTPKNETRELRGLREAMNAFAIEEGFILTNDEERELSFEGAKIQVMPVWKWLRAARL